MRAIMWFGAVALFCVLSAWPGRVEAAGGAYAVDDADIGPSSSCQNEAWASYSTRHDFIGVESPACVFTVGLPIEFTALYQRARTAREWATGGGFQAKAVPINNDRIAVSWAFGVAKDFTLERNLYFANFPITWKFSKDFRIHTNVGYLHDGRVNVDYATGGVGFDWDFSKRISLMGEVYIQGGRAIQFRTVTEPRTQLGLRFIPIPTVDVDFIYGQNLTGRSAHWITLGLTLRTQ
jgi:hypothetical protein